MTEHTCTQHEPGTAACAGGPHRCPCQPCRTANNRQHKRSRLGLSDIMPAAAVKTHLARLLAAGYSTNGIAIAAGLTNAQVVYTLNPAKRIPRRTARRLLAVTDPTGRVEATGTRRRLQALAALGWSFSAMAEHLGLSRAAVHHWTTRDRVAAESAQAARRLYDDLWNKRPPETTPMERMVANRNRNKAASSGWPLPMAWDDDTIDDPTAKPYKPRNGVLGLKGSLVENVEWLADTGEKLPAIARDLGITQDSIKAALWRANRRDLVARIMPELNDRHHQNQHTKGRAA